MRQVEIQNFNNNDTNYQSEIFSEIFSISIKQFGNLKRPYEVLSLSCQSPDTGFTMAPISAKSLGDVIGGRFTGSDNVISSKLSSCSPETTVEVVTGFGRL